MVVLKNKKLKPIKIKGVIYGANAFIMVLI